MRDLLINLGYENVWLQNSANYLCISRAMIIKTDRQNLGVEDLRLAEKSSSIPHYFSLRSGYGAERYLTSGWPSYVVNQTLQTRLNYSTFFCNSKCHNLGMFGVSFCRFCGEQESLSHLFSCSRYSELRLKILSSVDPNFTIDYSNINVSYWKHIHFFVKNAMKIRSI